MPRSEAVEAAPRWPKESAARGGAVPRDGLLTRRAAKRREDLTETMVPGRPAGREGTGQTKEVHPRLSSLNHPSPAGRGRNAAHVDRIAGALGAEGFREGFRPDPGSAGDLRHAAGTGDLPPSASGCKAASLVPQNAGQMSLSCDGELSAERVGVALRPESEPEGLLHDSSTFNRAMRPVRWPASCPFLLLGRRAAREQQAGTLRSMVCQNERSSPIRYHLFLCRISNEPSWRNVYRVCKRCSPARQRPSRSRS